MFFEENFFKKLSENLLTIKRFWYIIYKLSRRRDSTAGPWKLNKTETCGTLNVGLETHDNQFQNLQVIHTGRKRLCLSDYSDLTLCKWLNTIYKEFDPGSGRTLAARLTHASRTESRGACFSWLSGERVSNAWVTCPGVGDNSWKRLLIPHKPTVPHGSAGKGFIRFRMDSRPIS